MPLWTGTLAKYFDPKCSLVNQTADGEGHIAYRVRSSRLADGSPEAVRITSRAEQLAYIRAEGLSDPFDTNHSGDRDYDYTADQKKVQVNARGVYQ